MIIYNKMNNKDIDKIRESLKIINNLISAVDEADLFENELESAELSSIRISSIMDAREYENIHKEKNDNLILKTTHIDPFGKDEHYKIFIDENNDIQIFVNDKNVPYYNNGEIISKILCDAIDMDSWKHSWHINTSGFKEEEIFEKLKNIIIDKKNTRQKELDYLTSVEKLLETIKKLGLC